MKINFPFQLQLKIEKQYGTNVPLLPIGFDCHPAYLLSKLQVRNESLPFDWLDTEPHLALQFAQDTIESEFQFFLNDLQKNEKGKVFSAKHPEALFYHFDDLIQNADLQNKIVHRAQRFVKLYKENKIFFLHTISSSALEQKNDLDFIIKSIKRFTKILKSDDKLLIYLRFDESLLENKKQAALLKDTIDLLPKVKLIFYVREKMKFGIWGDEKKYKELLNNFGIKIKWLLPKFTVRSKK